MKMMKLIIILRLKSIKSMKPKSNLKKNRSNISLEMVPYVKIKFSKNIIFAIFFYFQSKFKRKSTKSSRILTNDLSSSVITVIEYHF